jgi:hypothetical protein
MRSSRYLIAALLLGAATAPLSAQKQISLLATISDPTGGEIANLSPADLKVTEDGKDISVTNVQAVQRTPKLQILIDNGIGVPSASIGELRKGLKELLNTLPPMLEVSLVSTAPQPRFLEKATTDRVKQLSAIDRLTPDGSPGRFVESMLEAADRADKDKDENAAYTILAVGTTSGDVDVRDADVKKLFQLVQKKHLVIHVTMLNVGTGSQQGGGNQIEVGQSLTRGTGGRYEYLAVPNRLATLLPEMGMQMASALGPGAKQFRITVDRAGSGTLGKLGLAVSGGRVVSSVTMEAKK